MPSEAVETKHQVERITNVLPKLGARSKRRDLLVVENWSMWLERAALAQRKEPLDVIVHVLETIEVPRLNLLEGAAARVGATSGVKIDQRCRHERECAGRERDEPIVTAPRTRLAN